MLQKIIICLTIISTLLHSGCKGNRDKTGYFDTAYLSAEKEFTSFLKRYTPEIEQILEKYGMYPEYPGIQEKEVIQWHIYKQPDNKEKDQYRILATVTICAEQKLYGMRLPEYIYLGFVYNNGQWRAVFGDESFTSSVSHSFSLTGLTFHIYEDIKKVFLYD
jgi:hypothetical protein